MEMDLSGLIEKIKKEGIEETEKKSRDITRHAEKKAHDIVVNAEEDAKRIIKEANEEAVKLRRQAEESIRQSIRDAILLLKQRIVDLFDTVLKREITKELSPAVLRDVIVKMIEGFKKDGANIEILLGEKDKEKLEGLVLNLLTGEMRKGVIFKVSPSIETGFRIGERDKNFYYDFTDEALAEALRAYLNPKLIKILDAK